MYARVSPGERTTAQRIATADRTVTRFLLDVMGSLSFLRNPFGLLVQTAACLRPHSFFRVRASFCISHSRSTGSSGHLTEIAGGGIPRGEIGTVLERRTHVTKKGRSWRVA